MRVLLVEDDQAIARALASGLTADGCGVDIASNGIDGLWRAREFDYDVVVLDWLLPGLLGHEVLRQLRSDRIWTPVLMLTARDGDNDHADALDLGADDYLCKPFSYQVVLAHLRALVRRGAPARPAVLTSGDLSWDPAARRCRRGEVLIELTTREGALLELFLRRPDAVLSKSEILANVWDEFFEGDPNIVEVYVLRLRRKIDAPFGTASIDTVRGAGYRWSTPVGP